MHLQWAVIEIMTFFSLYQHAANINSYSLLAGTNKSMEPVYCLSHAASAIQELDRPTPPESQKFMIGKPN